MFTTVYLAAEDEPGLAVGCKLIAQTPPLAVYRTENGHGFGTLKRKTRNYQRMVSNGLPVLMITDLDAYQCPSEKIGDWLGAVPSNGFLFRICVREIEAWLLADRLAVASFFQVSQSQIPMDPELLPDPKQKLIVLAQGSSKRDIRVGFMPAGTASIGPRYNQLLDQFVREFWDPQKAAHRAPSLKRALSRLASFAASFSDRS